MSASDTNGDPHPAQLDYVAGPRPDPRPWQVRAVGWTAVALGYGGILVKPTQLAPLLLDPALLMKLNPAFQQQRVSQFELWANVASVSVSFALSVLALVGGLALLRMRAWGARVLLVYAALALATTPVNAALSFRFLDTTVTRTQSATTQPISAEQARGMHGLSIVTGALMRVPFPLLIFGLLLHRNVRRPLERAALRRQRTRPAEPVW